MKNTLLPTLIFIILGTLIACKPGDNAPTDEVPTGPVLKVAYINNDSLHYIERGSGETVIFVHGTLGDYRGFQGQVDTFSQQHKVITYSRLYAYPDTMTWPDTAQYYIDPHVEELAAFIRHLNTGAVHLIGHSYGAMVALHVALKFPDLARTLVLGEPPEGMLIRGIPQGDSLLQDFDVNYRLPAGQYFREGKDEEALSIFLAGVTGDSLAYSRIPAEFRPMLMANIAELRGAAFTANPFPLTTCEELSTIKVPVMLVGGAVSPAFFDRILDELERCLQTETRVTLPNTSHELQDQSPAEFNRVVLPFIEKN